MAKAPKIERVICYSLLKLLRPIKIKYATNVYLYFLERWGVNFEGRPNYISSGVDIDGSDYSLFTFGDGITISSYVRLLTHDWAPHTMGKAMGVFTEKPLGHLRPIAIGDNSFVGTGSVVMPGTKIGKGCVIGAGTVVRGEIPDYSLVIGSPCKIIGDTRDYMSRKFPEFAETIADYY